MPSEESRVSSIFVVPFVQIVVGIFLVIALITRQRELSLLAILVLGVMTGTRLWSRLSLIGLTARTRVDKYKAFPDEKINLYVETKNRKWFP
ncbi:hypothetical protein ACFL2O_06655, partial [Thermodesulfobacteriota bacterium]